MPQLVLVVEGSDDSAVVYHLLNRHRLPLSERDEHRPDTIKLEDGQGVNNVLESLPIRLRVQMGGDSPTRLGIVLDADAIGPRWEAIQARLPPEYEQHVPAHPSPEGTIIAVRGLPLLGFWLMPNNQTDGEVEDFARLLIPQADRLWTRAEQAVLDIPAADRLFPEHDLMKAKIHTWLAWQSEPGKPMGQAIT